MDRLAKSLSGVVWRTVVSVSFTVTLIASTYVIYASYDTIKRAQQRKAEGLTLVGHLPRSPQPVRPPSSPPSHTHSFRRNRSLTLMMMRPLYVKIYCSWNDGSRPRTRRHFEQRSSGLQ